MNFILINYQVFIMAHKAFTLEFHIDSLFLFLVLFIFVSGVFYIGLRMPR